MSVRPLRPKTACHQRPPAKPPALSTSPPQGALTTVYVALVLVQIWFASFSVVAKLALREIGPRGLIVVRVVLATLVFLLAWAARGRERVALRDLARIAVYAVFGIVLNQLLFIEGLKRTTATNAVVLGASIPVFTVAVALVLGRERATLTKLLGLSLALIGALTVTGWSHFQGSSTMLTGNLLVLCNSLSYSIYLVISREILARYRALTVIAFTFLIGTLGILPFGLGEFLRDAPHLRPGTWVALGYIVAFPSVGTYLLNTYALARVEASLVAIYIYLQPVLGAVLALSVLDERPTLGTVLGCGLIFGGIWLVGQDARRRGRPKS